MKNYTLLLLAPVLLFSCKTARDMNCIKLKKTKVHLTYDGKMWNAHLKLKKGNYFIYYTSIFGIERIDIMRGQYTVKDDSLYLSYCNPDPGQVADTAYIDHFESVIVLHRKNNNFKQELSAKKGKLNRLNK